MEFCLSVFIFDAENHVVSAYLGGGFSADPVRETTVTVTEEDAIRLARDFVNGRNEVADWKYRGWETMDDPGVYDHPLAHRTAVGICNIFSCLGIYACQVHIRTNHL